MKNGTKGPGRFARAALYSAISLACGGALAQEAPANRAPPAG